SIRIRDGWAAGGQQAATGDAKKKAGPAKNADPARTGGEKAKVVRSRLDHSISRGNQLHLNTISAISYVKISCLVNIDKMALGLNE
ncbi:MAG: hypothetical protein WBF93_18045, partial [Pirellulales bacterium]